MAMSGLIGEQEDTARLKLLLSDRVQQGSFCLTFDYRVVGRNVGTLRVLLDNNVYPVWEQSHTRHQSWQTELLTVAWKAEAPEAVSQMVPTSAFNATILYCLCNCNQNTITSHFFRLCLRLSVAKKSGVRSGWTMLC